MKSTRIITPLLLCLALTACGEGEAPAPEGAQGASPGFTGQVQAPEAQLTPGQGAAPEAPSFVGAVAPPADHVLVPGQRDGVGGVDLTPSPEASSRLLRRLSVSQLREAIRNATGGLVWRDERGRDMLDVLRPSLGVPDYVDSTSEDLEASLVFQKFLGDGARSVCDEAVAIDLQAAPEERVLMRFVDPALSWEAADEEGRAAVDRNLRYLKLRFTGQHVAPEDEEGVSRERWLLRSVTHATGDPGRGWRAVCVGLMASPEFYLY